jgi:toxin YhaV
VPICPDGSGAGSGGWRLLAWPEFAQQFAALEREAARLAAADPGGYVRHPQVKLYAAVRKLIKEVIPADPGAREFQLGNTLGPQHRHWRRAKFSGRFRLFYRFHTASRTIVYAWMNDEGTLRKEGSRTDPYWMFRKMLEAGRPPSEWQDLLKASDPFRAD